MQYFLGNQVTIETANARATTVATSVRKATILHVLNLVLNKHSFRSSDSANSKRAIYAKMFPDSAATSINCGKTKAMYLAVHGLAPYAKRKLVLDASNKLFGVHVDETSYNKKNRLEFWIGFIGDRIRKSKYLTTIEIETKLDIEAFIKSSSSVKSIDDIKLVDSESVFNATVAALQQHNLDLSNLVYLMTDNCSVMRGRKSGFRALMEQQCPKIIDFPGCASHQLNLIQKSEVRAFDTFAQIVKIIELFSSFLNCTPKAQSIMKQCSDFLDVVNYPVYTSVRFLSLYESMLAFLESFPVVTKLISISSDNALKTCFNKEKNFALNLDQAVIHVKPIYVLTKVTQDPKLSVYEQLQHMLQVIAQLMSRMGLSVEISSRSYISKLFIEDERSGKKVPRVFVSKKKQLETSNLPLVTSKLIDLSKDDELKIVNNWNLHNEFQLKSVLDRFSNFLQSPLASNVYLLYTPLNSFTPVSDTKFKKLASFFKLSATGVLDELLSFRTDLSEEQRTKTLKCLYEDGSCSTFHQLTELVESCLLVSTHNMIVESGFSLMKTTETSYQSNMTTETYDALRTIQDFWDLEDFEEIEITSELESSVASASERYREVTKENQVLNSRKRTYAEELRTEVQVFKRYTPLL